MDEHALVRAARADPGRGFGAIYRRYGDRIHDYCLAVLRHREDAADATSDTFLLAYQRLGQLRDPGRLTPWLYAIARSRCLDRIRDRGRQRPTGDLEPLSPAEPPATGQVEVTELRRLVWEAAAGLAAGDRAVLDLHLRQGLSGGELADALGVPAEKANLMLHRMKLRMRHTIGALLVARTGRRDCPDLAAITTGRLTPLIRKRLARHIDRCQTCRDRRDRLALELLYGSVPLAPAPVAIGDRLTEFTELTATGTDPAAGPATGLATGGDGGGFWSGTLRWRADGFPRPVAAPLPAAQRLAVGAGVVALVGLGLLGGLVTGRAIADDESPPDPAAAAATEAPDSPPASGTPGRAGNQGPSGRPAPSAAAPPPGRPGVGGPASRSPTPAPTGTVPPPTVRITSPADGHRITEFGRAIVLDSETTDPAGFGLDLTWSITYPYHPATGTGPTTEVLAPVPLWPSGVRWRLVDTFDTETWCDLAGRPIRLQLQVVDVHGRTGTDQIVMYPYRCIEVD